MLGEPALGLLHLCPAHRDPAAPAVDDRFQTMDAKRARGKVPEDIAEHRPCGARDHHQPEAELALSGRDAGDRHDHFRRNWRKDGFQEHQEANAEIARLLDQADDPVTHRAATLAAIASQIRAGVSDPLNLSIATMPVGEVTLISVISPPMTSMPTNSRPRRFNSGPIASQISCSRAVSSVCSAVPPAARLERNSPSFGLRLMAPATSPSTRTMRLSPSATAGRKAWAIYGSCQMEPNSSARAVRFVPSRPIRNTPSPALPWSGLTTISP